jgi:hypothetical protein
MTLSLPSLSVHLLKRETDKFPVEEEAGEVMAVEVAAEEETEVEGVVDVEKVRRSYDGSA